MADDFSMKRLGFIGLGVMGKHMAKNLIKAGYPLCVWNRTRSKMDELVAFGAISAESPKDVAERSEVVITMVSDSPDVEEIILGSSGVIEGGKPGTTVIDMSTISPQITQHIAEKLSEKGLKMLDAPVSGGDTGARDGTLSIMVGGSKEAFEDSLPILKVMGKRITHMGESGMGQATKLCNQVICAINIQAVCEGLMLGTKLGINLEKLLEVVTAGSANSWMLSNLGPKMVKRDFEPGFKITHQQKDLKLALLAAAELRLPLPGTALVQQMFRSVEAEELAEKGNQTLIIAMEKLSATKVG